MSIKCVKNWYEGWQAVPLTESCLKKKKGTWAEVLNADDFIKPIFDIDLKIGGEEGEEVDYSNWIDPIKDNIDSAMADKFGEDLSESLVASSSGWNKEKKSHYVSLHITYPKTKILFKNMKSLARDLGFAEEEQWIGCFREEKGGGDFEFEIDWAIYEKSRQCLRLINQDKPIKGGGKAGRRKVKYPLDAPGSDWEYVISNVSETAHEITYENVVLKKQTEKSKKSSGATLKFGPHHLDQWIKKTYPGITRRCECENCVYYDFDLSDIKNRFCQFKMNDSARNHGIPDTHAIFGNYIMWNKNSGRIFRRCRCPDGTCPSSSLELNDWRELGMWEDLYMNKGEDSMVECMNETLAHIRFEEGKQVYITHYGSVKDFQEVPKGELSDCYECEGWDIVGEKGGITRMDPIKIWRRSRKHLKLNKRVFEPESPIITSEGNLNLWKGYNICMEQAVNFIENENYGWKQAREDWNFYKNHIEEHLCNGDLDLSNYVLNWMSHLLQRPGKKTEVMLVVKGPEGVGKSVVFAKDSQFQRIIAESCKYGPFYQISETNRLFSRFNDRMKDVRYVVLNEALFAGDKKTLSQLKELITDPIITTEKKFGNAVNLDQFYDFVSITNYERASPFTTSSRRWQGIECGNKLSKEGKTKAEKDIIAEYFKKFVSIPPQVVAYYLYDRDISTFNPPNDIVYNRFMVEQSEYGRSIVEKFVIAMADAGYVRFRGEVHYGGGLTTAWIPNFLFLLMDSKTLFNCFEAYKRSVRFNDKYGEVSEQTLLTQIKTILGPNLFKQRKMDKGLVGFSGVGISATREYLDTKYKISSSGVGWSSDLTYCSGCYKKYYTYIRIDNHSDKMRIKGGTLKNKEKRTFLYSTMDEEGNDERIKLGLIKRCLYQFKREEKWVYYNKKGGMIHNGGVANHDDWKVDQLENLNKEEFKKLKKVQPEGQFFGRPSNEDLYDSDIDEDELEEEKIKEGVGDHADMEKVLDQKINDYQNQAMDAKEYNEEQLSESGESEDEDDDSD
jgi:hypothetical protein|tara:strand:+ start:2849 stop:5884 length:3036 start_codon:yes stop_codon:yes gene_type:complete